PHASIAEIAARAGLSRRALYGHFDDRNAIVREVIATGAARFNAIADRIHDHDSRLALARLVSELWREAAHVQAAASHALDD
ncbi:TetR family transcriptional regulator, partial [Enterococcus faecium]